MASQIGKICLLVLMLAAGHGLSAQERLSLADARALAATLLGKGQPAAAREIARGLLEANPRDIGALLLMSQAERALGNTVRAVQAGEAAWAFSGGVEQRFLSATVVAQAHASAGNFTRAQLWLRRAANNAPNDQMAALVARDYQQVQQANPWSVNLSFGALPTNNVNNGNSNRALTFAYLPGPLANIEWEVPPDSRPLSGIALTGEIGLSYRLAQSPTTATELNLSLFAQGYVLSDQARTTAPDVTARSLGYQQVSLGLSHTWVAQGSANPTSIDLSYTHALYGGDPYTGDIALTFAHQWLGTGDQVFAASAAVNRTTYLADRSHADGLMLRGSWQNTLANDDTLGLSLNATRVAAARPDRGYDAIGLQASYDFGQIAEWLELSVSAGLEKRVYTESNLDPAGRSDIRKSLQVNLGLPALAMYGFEPVAALSASQTNSSVPFFETESVRLGVQLKSSF